VIFRESIGVALRRREVLGSWGLPPCGCGSQNSVSPLYQVATSALAEKQPPGSTACAPVPRNCATMATAAAPAPQPPLQPPPQQQPPNDQQVRALAVNALRLKAIGDRIRNHLDGVAALPITEFAHLVYAFARCPLPPHRPPPLATPSFLGFSAAAAPPAPSSPLLD
jgi:hypothetical protein